MKTILVLLISTIIISCQIYAQEETLFGRGEISHGGFGGPVVKYTQIKNEPALLVGGRGGWIINHSFMIGGGGYGLVNNINKNNLFVSGYFLNRPYINFGYGGIEVEYIALSDNLAHFSVCTLIGGGGVSYRNNLWEDNYDNNDWNSPSDAFFVFEPSLNAELNVISFLRLNAGISYRFVSGINLDDLKDSDFAGPSAVLTLKFGKF